MIINQITAGGGSTPEPYPLLSRVKDDSNNEIGTVGCYFTGPNNQKYAVVVLDAQYRLASGAWMSASVSPTGMALQNTQTCWESTDTSTYNCDKILECCNDNGYTSTGVSHCRSKTFVIGGQTYAGQLANMIETTLIFMHRTAINNADTSASSYPSLILPSGTNMWTSSQFSSTNGCRFNRFGTVDTSSKINNNFIMPVLEIPIQ